jgi:hypothetical protein
VRVEYGFRKNIEQSAYKSPRIGRTAYTRPPPPSGEQGSGLGQLQFLIGIRVRRLRGGKIPVSFFPSMATKRPTVDLNMNICLNMLLCCKHKSEFGFNVQEQMLCRYMTDFHLGFLPC